MLDIQAICIGVGMPGEEGRGGVGIHKERSSKNPTYYTKPELSCITQGPNILHRKHKGCTWLQTIKRNQLFLTTDLKRQHSD